MCTALQLGGDVEQPWLMTSSIKPEVYNLSLRRQRRTEPRPYVTCRKKIGEDRTCNAGDMIADRHTHRQTHRHAQHNTPLPYRGRRNDSRRTTYLKICRTDLCQIFRMCRTLAADDQSKLLFRSFKGRCHDNLLLMALSIGLIFVTPVSIVAQPVDWLQKKTRRSSSIERS